MPGNSKVLVEANSNEFWIDSNNTRKNASDPTCFIQTPISKYTKEKIYPGGSQVYNLIDWYFQYVSESDDHCRLTTFVVWGYKPEISCQYALTSSSPFKYFGDGYNFFIAISNDDVYLTNVYQENHWGKYELWTGLLSDEVKDPKCRAEVFCDFDSALIIVYHENNFYILTKEKFIVYGGCRSYFKKLYEVKLTSAITCNDDLEDVITDYMNKCPKTFVTDNYVDNKEKKVGDYDNKWSKNDKYGGKKNH